MWVTCLVDWTEEGTPLLLCPAAPLCVSSLFLLALSQLQRCDVSDLLVHVIISECAQPAFGMIVRGTLCAQSDLGRERSLFLKSPESSIWS